MSFCFLTGQQRDKTSKKLSWIVSKKQVIMLVNNWITDLKKL